MAHLTQTNEATDDSESIGESDSNIEAWDKINLLTIDGGGIRGLWALLALETLMQYIGMEEESLASDGNQQCSSFSPEPFPRNLRSSPTDSSLEARDINPANRYLPCHYFDFIGGASTGALIAIMLGRLRMRVPDCIREYRLLGGEIFGRPRPLPDLSFYIWNRPKYHWQRPEEVFKDVCQRMNEARENDLQEGAQDEPTFELRRYMCKTFVTTFQTKKPSDSGAEIRLLRSYDHEEKNYGKSRKLEGFTRNHRAATFPHPRRNGTNGGNLRNSTTTDERVYPPRMQQVGFGPASKLAVWRVARGATAAEGYFEPFEFGNTTYTDGGYNQHGNPTILGIEEIEERYGKDATNIIVSIGTAKANIAPKKNIKGMFRGYLDRSWNPELVHGYVEKLKNDRSFEYFRVNDPEALKLELDDWRPRYRPWRNKEKTGSLTIDEIELAFGKWTRKPEVGSYFTNIAKHLVRVRRSRSKFGSRWEAFATGAEYSCPHRAACPGDGKFSGRDELRNHLLHQHGQRENRSYNEGDQYEDTLKEYKIKEWKYKHHELWEEPRRHART